MSESLLLKLREVTEKALNSETIEEGMKHLAKAFLLFSQESNALKESYDILKKRFSDVNEELEKTNTNLNIKNRELKTLSHYLNHILTNISQGIIFINSAGIVTTYNKEAQYILNKNENEVLFKKFSEVFPDDLFDFSIKNALRFNLSYNNTIIKLKNEKFLEVSAQNTPNGIIIIFKDITEIKKLQTIANRNETMNKLGQMSATVAHEIKNPLGGIRGFAYLLHSDLENTKHLQEMAGYIIDGTKTLERLVNNVLHFAKPVDPVLKETNICTFIKNICKFIEADLSFSENVSLETHMPQNDIYVDADEGLLHMCMLNLILNAYQSITTTGKVTLSVLKNNNNCTISISDTGSGIDEKDLENIFSPFFTTKKSGNGFGLSEAFKIIRAHKGIIDVRSSKGFGSTFTITLAAKEKSHGYSKNFSC